ncbi:uncharacterized protein LOC131937018 [Physella acuta]|uniref:uncharacterized protein LOC131937018 n=1 Tax=Physella acuta TaxID=109671 RepID=UPI0027DD80EB|nr:uncharacterized protein LOC131937018 [Physella acuta]
MTSSPSLMRSTEVYPLPTDLPTTSSSLPQYVFTPSYTSVVLPTILYSLPKYIFTPSYTSADLPTTLSSLPQYVFTPSYTSADLQTASTSTSISTTPTTQSQPVALRFRKTVPPTTTGKSLTFSVTLQPMSTDTLTSADGKNATFVIPILPSKSNVTVVIKLTLNSPHTELMSTSFFTTTIPTDSHQNSNQTTVFNNTIQTTNTSNISQPNTTTPFTNQTIAASFYTTNPTLSLNTTLLTTTLNNNQTTTPLHNTTQPSTITYQTTQLTTTTPHTTISTQRTNTTQPTTTPKTTISTQNTNTTQPTTTPKTTISTQKTNTTQPTTTRNTTLSIQTTTQTKTTLTTPYMTTNVPAWTTTNFISSITTRRDDSVRVLCNYNEVYVSILHYGCGVLTTNDDVTCRVIGSNASDQWSVTEVYRMYTDPATNVTLTISGNTVVLESCLAPGALLGFNKVSFLVSSSAATTNFTLNVIVNNIQVYTDISDVSNTSYNNTIHLQSNRSYKISIAETEHDKLGEHNDSALFSQDYSIQQYKIWTSADDTLLVNIIYRDVSGWPCTLVNLESLRQEMGKLCLQNQTDEDVTPCCRNITACQDFYNDCIRQQLEKMLSFLNANESTISTKGLDGQIQKLDMLTEQRNVVAANAEVITHIIDQIGDILQNENLQLTPYYFEILLNLTDVLLSVEHQTGQTLLMAVDKITSPNNINGSVSLDKDNLAVECNSTREDITFSKTFLLPNTSIDSMSDSETQISFSKDNYPETSDEIKFCVLIFRVSEGSIRVLPSIQEKYPQGSALSDSHIVSNIIQLKVNVTLTTVEPPVKMFFSKTVSNESFQSPSCGFLNTSVKEGVWASKGCKVVNDTSNYTQCECSHLTNFAVLARFSRSGLSKSDLLALNIISIIGISISLFCLLLTLVVYILVWKFLNHDHSVLHINLCLCLIVSYIIFLAGVDRTEDLVACTVVAALLHFFFLSVFFSMLGEGILVFTSVAAVFSIRGRSRTIITLLIIIAYGVPLIIVGVSLGVTRTQGYGNRENCWLMIDNGLIWAFIGPVLFVIGVNLVILVKVIRVIQSSHVMRDKSALLKAKSVLRSLCVLSPIFGMTWVFGVLSVNNETIVFEYLFAIFNSLQGLFVFIFQCLLLKQVREGLKALKHKLGFDCLNKPSNKQTRKIIEIHSQSNSNECIDPDQQDNIVTTPTSNYNFRFRSFYETRALSKSKKGSRKSRRESSSGSWAEADTLEEELEVSYIFMNRQSFHEDTPTDYVQSNNVQESTQKGDTFLL